MWAQLDAVLTTPYGHAAGSLRQVLATSFDTAGHRTDYVYDDVKGRQRLRVFATIGRDGERRAVAPASVRL